MVGVDISPEMVERGPAKGAREREPFVRARRRLVAAVPDASFDLVTAANMIPFFDELARVVRPGGHVVFAFSLGDADADLRRARPAPRGSSAARGFTDFAEIERGSRLGLRRSQALELPLTGRSRHGAPVRTSFFLRRDRCCAQFRSRGLSWSSGTKEVQDEGRGRAEHERVYLAPVALRDAYEGVRDEPKPIPSVIDHVNGMIMMISAARETDREVVEVDPASFTPGGGGSTSSASAFGLRQRADQQPADDDQRGRRRLGRHHPDQRREDGNGKNSAPVTTLVQPVRRPLRRPQPDSM